MSSWWSWNCRAHPAVLRRRAHQVPRRGRERVAGRVPRAVRDRAGGVDFGPISFTVQAFLAIAAPLSAWPSASTRERRAPPGHAAAPAVAADPPRRRDQRQVRGRPDRDLLALGALILFVVGFGMLRLGIAPSVEEILRLAQLVRAACPLRGTVAGLRHAAVGRHPARRHLGPRGLRCLALRGPPHRRAAARVPGPVPRRRGHHAGRVHGTLQWVQRLLPGQLFAEASVAL